MTGEVLMDLVVDQVKLPETTESSGIESDGWLEHQTHDSSRKEHGKILSRSFKFEKTYL
jgi:hypothetical protein